MRHNLQSYFPTIPREPNKIKQTHRKINKEDSCSSESLCCREVHVSTYEGIFCTVLFAEKMGNKCLFIRCWLNKSWCIYILEYYTVGKRNEAKLPGGPTGKNPPANAGFTGLIPGPVGLLHAKWATKPCRPQPLSPLAATTEAQAPRGCAQQQEKPLRREARSTAAKNSSN